MHIKIKKLTPALLDDFLYFFDTVGFSDHKEWSKCYCMFFHMTDEMEKQYEKTKEVRNRENAIEYIKKGRLSGYLAYAGGKAVGWMNAGNKNSFYALSRNKCPKLWADYAGERIKSVVCFLVAPDMRGKGIATKLLKRAVKDARREKYELMEAYPIKSGEKSCFLHYHGPLSLYEKCGFAMHRELDAYYIFRRDFRPKEGRVALVCPYKVED